jgi:tetratricopeptide (TPR) repeat protein
MVVLRRLGLVVLALPMWATAVHAEECTDDPAACGRSEFDAGIDAYKAGDYQKAAAHFTAAYGYRKHPVVLFNLALAEARLGQVVEALDHFDQVLADPETPKDLVSTIEREKRQADAQVGKLEIDAGLGAETYVDDRRVEGEPAQARVNPGDHSVRVVVHGRTALERSVHLGAGERLRLAVDRAPAPPPPPPPKPPPPPPPPPPSGPSPLYFYAGAGLSAVLGGVTVWSALDTRRAYDDYQRDLPTLAQSEVNQRVDDGHKKELRTNVLIGVTAVSLVGTAALGLFVVDWGAKKQAPRVGLVLSPAGVAAAGRF